MTRFRADDEDLKTVSVLLPDVLPEKRFKPTTGQGENLTLIGVYLPNSYDSGLLLRFAPPEHAIVGAILFDKLILKLRLPNSTFEFVIVHNKFTILWGSCS